MTSPSQQPDSSRWSFAVLGPGGVGGLLAGLLARDGHEVTVIAREQTAARLAEHGLTVRSAALGDTSLTTGGPATGGPAGGGPATGELAGGRSAAGGDTAPAAATFGVTTQLTAPVDACLVTVKAMQLDAACDRVPPERLGGGLVVPFLNGVEHVEALRRRYPPAAVVAATISVEAYVAAPGEVVQGSPFARVALAVGQADRARVEALAEHLDRTGLSVRVRDSEAAVLWDKLRFLGPLALATTHAAAPVGVVRSRDRERLHALIREISAVARAEGVDADPDQVIAQIDAIPERMESSMQRDAAAGRPTEIEAIGGAVLRAATRLGVPAPVTGQIVADLRAAERARVASMSPPR